MTEFTDEDFLPPIMKSGHCLVPQTNNPAESHERCQNNGAGNRARPGKAFSPCPCTCHLGKKVHSCADCGRPIKKAKGWPRYLDGEARYTHIDPRTGEAVSDEVCRK